MSRLYAVDAAHEFPFTAPGFPTRLEGREEIMDWISAGWDAGLLGYEQYRTVAVHDTADSGKIVVEQEAIGTSKATGDFALPNIMVLTVSGGQITCFRDYVNIPAAMAALGLAVRIGSRRDARPYIAQTRHGVTVAPAEVGSSPIQGLYRKPNRYWRRPAQRSAEGADVPVG